MFLGEYFHSLDDKNRVKIPAKLKENLGEKFVITKGLDLCLFIFPFSEWRLFEKKLSQLPLSDPNSRKFVRYFFSGACELEPDKQGRILIPNTLREFASLQKEIVLIGVLNRIEIWDMETWTNYSSCKEFSDTELSQLMGDLQILI